MAFMTFQFRRDTAANWTAANPTLLSGELGLETDTRKMKFGDGTTAWNSLAYWQAVDIADLIDVDVTGAVAGDVLKFDGTEWVDGRVALDELSDVVLTTPATGALLRYDGTNWIDALPTELYHGTTKVLETAASKIQVTDRQVNIFDTAGWGTVALDGANGGSVDFYDSNVYKSALYYFNNFMVFDAQAGTGMVFTTGGTGDPVKFQPNYVDVLVATHNGTRGKVEVNRLLNIVPAAGDVASPANGDVWYNSTTGKFMAREAGVSFEMLARPADIGLFIQGKPTNAELVLRLEIPRACTFPSGAASSHASARVASTGTVSFDVLKNGVSFGTITFTAAATGTFTQASDATFAAGDVLTITAPATADATLEDISITLFGYRTT